MKVDVIRPEFVEFIPRVLEPGVLYISQKYRTASHLCACGCGEKVVTPLSPVDWQLQMHDRVVSLYPSIGNWNYACKSHYCIRCNRISWAYAMSKREVSRVAAFFLEPNHSDEYNALKHGFRVRAGGFKLAVGTEDVPGVPPPDEAMKLLVSGKWGAMFSTLSPAYPGSKEGKLTAVPTVVSVNWSLEQSARLLQLVGTSISNVASAARIANGVPATEVQFHRPEDDEIFSLAWRSDLAVTSLKMTTEAKIPLAPLSKNQLLEIIQVHTDAARAMGLAEGVGSGVSNS